MVFDRGVARLALSALCLLLSAGSCGTAPHAPINATPAASSLCKADALDACEKAIAIATSEDRDAAALFDAYAAARATRDARDPWANLWRAVKASGGAKNAILLEDADELPSTIKADVFLVRTPSLPDVATQGAEALLTALASAAGFETIVHVRGKPAAVTLLFPRDPLRPFMAGLPPVVRDDGALARLDLALEIAASIRRAVEHASSFRYAEAAHEAEKLRALVADLDIDAEPALRARYLLTLLDNAGIALLPPTSAEGSEVRPDKRPSTTPTPTSTPYGDLLRVRAAKDEKAAWKSLGSRIERVAPERARAGLVALFGPAEACIEAPLPSFDGPEDLVFAYGLGRTLAPTISGDAPKGTLPLAEWLPRYDALVGEVDAARTTWSHAFALTQQRGQIGGLSLATTPTFRRVGALVAAHLAALSQLEQAHPDRLRAMSIVTLAYAPGLVSDEALRGALVSLLRRSVEGKLSRATDAGSVFEAALTGALAATAYPPAIQSAFYSGLLAAFQDKLAKDMSQQTGWGVAGLFATDALVRFLIGDKPDLDAAATQIARTLSEPSTPRLPLARLAASSARYLALGSAHALDPDATEPARFSAPRKAARDALREAIAGLADPKQPLPQGLLDDVTTLGDQTITFVSTVLLDKPEGQSATCSAGKTKLGPAARRVLARIGDVRRRILASPSYAKKENASIRRLRLVVTLLSDAVDLAARTEKEKPAAFTIPLAEAERDVAAALAEWDDAPLANTITAVYGIARGVLGERPSKSAATIDADRLGRLVSALALLFRDEKTGSSIGLLDALAKTNTTKPTGPGLEAMLVSYARSLREQGKPDQADLCLLGAMLVAVAAERPPPEEAIAATDAAPSELGWALRFAREVYAARKGKLPDSTAYAAGMRGVVARACEDPSIADDMLAVMETIRAAGAGSRAKAAATLDELLAKAEVKGLRVPRMSYRYEEKTVTKVFTASLDMSLGAGLIEGSSSFQLGLGVRSPAAPEGSFVAHLAPTEGPDRDAEAARYYVHARAIAAAYHFLEGEAELGAKDAARAIDAAVFGARLGGRSLGAPDPKTIAADAKGMLAITAVLAADAGMPLLAGDLVALVRGTLDESTNDRAIKEILATPPVAVAAMPDVKPVIDRAARALRVVGEPLACTEEKVELGGFDAPACDAYPLALALRAGGALRKLPRLRRGACAGPMPALDAFLGSVEQKSYDPDAFTRATLELSAAGRTYDAAILLARQRQPTHCNPSLLAAARSIGRSPALGASLRADVLSVAVNCASLDNGALDDIAALDAETSSLADRSRNLALLVFAAELGLARDRWDVLAKLAKSPTFVSRWLDTTPQASLVAVALARAAAVLASDPSLAEPTARPFALFCAQLPPSDPKLCETIAAIDTSTEAGARTKAARGAIEAALQRVSRGRDRR